MVSVQLLPVLPSPPNEKGIARLDRIHRLQDDVVHEVPARTQDANGKSRTFAVAPNVVEYALYLGTAAWFSHQECTTAASARVAGVGSDSGDGPGSASHALQGQDC